MRRHGGICLAAALLALFCDSAESQLPRGNLRLALLLASDYRHNGLSQTDGDGAARISVDYAREAGWFAGGYLANVEYAAEANFREPRDLEINAYGGYEWRRADWSTNVQVARYVYPDISVDYDYSEAGANFAFRDRWFLELGASDDYLGFLGTSYRYRGGLALPIAASLELGVNAGEFRATEVFHTRYGFWDVGLSRIFGPFALDLRYHDNSYYGASIYGTTGEDERWVLSATFVLAPGAPSPR
jgi:uncharacterized protein (TIGR02001 family)